MKSVKNLVKMSAFVLVAILLNSNQAKAQHAVDGGAGVRAGTYGHLGYTAVVGLNYNTGVGTIIVVNSVNSPIIVYSAPVTGPYIQVGQTVVFPATTNDAINGAIAGALVGAGFQNVIRDSFGQTHIVTITPPAGSAIILGNPCSGRNCPVHQDPQ